MKINIFCVQHYLKDLPCSLSPICFKKHFCQYQIRASSTGHRNYSYGWICPLSSNFSDFRRYQKYLTMQLQLEELRTTQAKKHEVASDITHYLTRRSNLQASFTPPVQWTDMPLIPRYIRRSYKNPSTKMYLNQWGWNWSPGFCSDLRNTRHERTTATDILSVEMRTLEPQSSEWANLVCFLTEF